MSRISDLGHGLAADSDQETNWVARSEARSHLTIKPPNHRKAGAGIVRRLRIRLEQLGRDGVGSGFSTRWGQSPHPALMFPAESFDGRSLFEIMEGCERRIILDMLTRTNWSQTEAADRFKIPLSTLNQKIKRLQIDVKRRRDT